MGLFSKLFIEEVPNDEMNVDDKFVSDDTDTIETNLEEVNVSTLIDDIYVQNELSDKTRSIFKVEELINSLPKEMMTETKKASVLAILTSFGLTSTDVVTDGENRINVLSSIITNIVKNGNDEISTKESAIEEHKKEIARLEKEISYKQNELKASEEIVDNEILRLSGLVKFVSEVK